ncbi:MAG: hypothetical protein K8S56_07030, partial [Candidatus Cloacimonetes bacterium]|nr:hypothetical protein [Candidatus Cloacimonadota bacterium]
MKALMFSPGADTKWLQNYFPHVNPYLLKIANKPLLEYFIDFCVLQHISEIRLVTGHHDTELEAYFGDGDKWGVELTYGLAKPKDTMKRVMLKNAAFCRNSELLIFYGYFFLHYNKNEPKYPFIINEAKDRSIGDDNSSLIILSTREEQEWRVVIPLEFDKLKLTSLESVRTYYRISMSILKEESSQYVLPGYSNEEGVFIGRNVTYPMSMFPEKPLMFGDNVQLKDNTSIGPNTILGD